MFQSKDGKKFGSAFVAKRRDSEHAKMKGMESPQHEKKETPDFEAGEQEGMKESNTEGQESQGKSVVAEHGPAVSVHIKHDHNSGKHRVTSMHKDGHVHESEHPTATEAHAEATQLGGGDVPEEDTSVAEEQPEPDGFKMPKLA